MKKIILTGTLACSILLTSCASVTSGTRQTISVSTTPVPGAQCNLHNDKGKWQLEKTPSDVIVNKSNKELIITCEKKGYHKGKVKVKHTVNHIVWGNILLGGIIGLVVDHSNGAAYQYPKSVTVPLGLKK